MSHLCERRVWKAFAAYLKLLRASEFLLISGADMLVSFLSQQKGRLRACKHRRVWRVANDAVNQTLAALQASGCPQDALQ